MTSHLKPLVIYSQIVCSYQSSTRCNLAAPKIRTSFGKKTFAFRGANAWRKFDSVISNETKSLKWKYSKKSDLHLRSGLFLFFI